MSQLILTEQNLPPTIPSVGKVKIYATNTNPPEIYLIDDNGDVYPLVTGGVENYLTFNAPLTRVVNTISIAQANGSTNGYLSSTNWTTFNNKGNGTVTSVSALTLGTTGTDLSSTIATGTTTPVITLNVPTASASNRGALSSADWTTFNNKQAALGFIPVAANSAIIGATKTKITYDTKGLVTSGADLIASDIPNITESQVTNLVTDLAAKVPYTGATSDVNLGEFGVQLGNIEFDTTPTNVPTTAGSLNWNDTDGTLDLKLKGGNVTLQVGQEQVVRVVNKTATNINLLEANYQAVRITGAVGQRTKVDLAQATTDVLSAETIGLVTETINNNQEGFITTSGLVRGINTTGSLQGETWADGDILYLSPTTAGSVTKVKPTAPNHLIVIGYVIYAHITQGTIFVKVDNGYELDELHNVKITTAANNNVLAYTSATDIWENKTVETALGFTPVVANSAITGATKTKITYDAKGLVTVGADATTADISDSTNKRYVTDANLTVINNTSGTNSGNQTLANTSDATSHTTTLSATGGSVKLVEGSGITLTTTGTSADGIITIASTNGGTVTSVTGTAPVVSSGGITPAISMAAATTSVSGYLTSTDWSTFNSKEEVLTFNNGIVRSLNTVSINYTRTENIYTGNGLVSSPLFTFNGSPFTGGSSTTTKPLILIEPSGTTSTAWSTSGTMFGINAASGFVGNLIDIKGNNTTRFKVTYDGNATVSGNLTIGSGTYNIYSFSGLAQLGAITSNDYIQATTYFEIGVKSRLYSPTDGIWLLSNNAATSFTRLVFGIANTVFPSLERSGTGLIVKLGDGSTNSNLAVLDDAYAVGWNGSNNVPTKNAIYDKIEAVTTSLGSYLPLAGGTMVGNIIFTDNTYDIGASGVTRPRTGYFGTSLISPLINGLTITNNGTNTLNIAAGKTLTVSNTLTFTGTDSSTLNIGTGGTLGTNAYTSTAYLPLTGGTLTGHLLFTDNTYDIGASGATRPRTGYFGTSITTPILNLTGNGAVSTPNFYGSGTWYSGGSSTTTKPYLLLEPNGTTSTNWSTSGTGLGINSATGFIGNFIHGLLANTEKFKFDYTGKLTIASADANINGLTVGKGNGYLSNNTAVGISVLGAITIGTANTGIGWETLKYNTEGEGNNGFGVWSLRDNTTGHYNSGLGYAALSQNTTGNGNSAVGRNALGLNLDGNYNTGIGYQAGGTNYAGTISGTNYNTFIGAFTAENIAVGASNNVVIGYDIDLPVAAGSYQLNIGNLLFGTLIDGVNTTVSSGGIGIGVAAVNASARLQIDSTTKGFLMPRWTTAQKTAISSPATGLLGYDTDLNSFYYYNGSWNPILSGSGYVTMTGVETLTNKRITKRLGTTTSSATPTINTDNYDVYSLTALAVDITSFTTNLSGTPTDSQTLVIIITPTATRNITWGASFEDGAVTLPTSVTGTSRYDIGFFWNTETTKWRCMAKG